ncbi:hypothetical protein MCEMRE130_00703 [Candidatus Nanopelagicaceae bacterium]|jgi:hypothetical protein
MNPLEKLMSEGTLTVTGRLVDASNATLYGTIVEGEDEVRVIYKPVAGERPLWDFPDGNLAQREYAAFLVSEIGGWNLVPLTILRDGPFGIGMVQQWIDIDESVDLALFYREDYESLRAMALFDAVVNNTDRKIGHLIPSPDGKLFGCDHGVTFHEEDKLRTVLWQWASQKLSEQELEQLRKLRQSLISEEKLFTSLISAIEFKALLGRVDRLIDEKTFPEPSDEWPAVPWPPF